MMAIKLDYFRLRRPLSPRGGGYSALWAGLPAAALLIAALPSAAQYVGKIDTKKQSGPELRAVGVLEWTGEPGHPKTSRLVPITVWDGEQLQDASIYLARPAPLALETEVEYKLHQDGKTIGLYVIDRAAQQQGSWVGYGAWKPLPAPKPAAPPEKIADSNFGGDSGRPILHRKNDSGASTGANGGSATPAAPPDPDRPTLKQPQPEETNKPAEAQKPNGEAYAQPLPAVSDPDRPRLVRGKPADSGSPVLPTLIGQPRDMRQTIAVSDVTNHPDHPWTYSWPSSDEEATMKSDLEEAARKALGLVPPPAPSQPAHTRTAAHKRAKVAPPPPAPLEDEQFRVFELEYGSGPTMVFSARTQGTGAGEKFITLIAQPDLYGNVTVLLKNQTDAAHLDVTPEMHLIDAVDAMADNRGELLFGLRGATQREFALYRVLHGQVQKLFTSAPEAVVMSAAESTAG